MFDEQKPFWKRLVDRDARCGPVPGRFAQNQLRLRDAIDSRQSFSTGELMAQFKSGGDTVLGSVTVQEELETLVAAGALRYEFGRYSH